MPKNAIPPPQKINATPDFGHRGRSHFAQTALSRPAFAAGLGSRLSAANTETCPSGSPKIRPDGTNPSSRHIPKHRSHAMSPDMFWQDTIRTVSADLRTFEHRGKAVGQRTPKRKMVGISFRSFCGSDKFSFCQGEPR